MWRVRGTRAFEELRHGSRGSHGPLTVIALPDPPGGVAGPPRVAFAIGRRVGDAVTRNRVRRRLRELVRRLPQPDVLVGGTYLVVVRPEAATMTSSELDHHLEPAVRRALAKADR